MAKPCPLICRTPISCLVCYWTWSQGTLVVAAASSWFHQKYPSWSLHRLVSPRQSTPFRMPCSLYLQQTPCWILQGCVETSLRSWQRSIVGAYTLQCVVLIGHARKWSFWQGGVTYASMLRTSYVPVSLHYRPPPDLATLPIICGYNFCINISNKNWMSVE